MSKFDELLDKYQDALKSDTKTAVDAEMLKKVAKGLGPSIYNRDSSLVSCSDPEELARVKANYLIKKLGLKDGPNLDAAIQAVCEEYDSRSKYRAVFYYMLAQKLGVKL
jgi:hypothetical protein